MSTSKTPVNPTALPCRLCGAPTQHRFDGLLLGRHRVGYHECSGCGSLQTDPPHWLAEAYAEGNLADTDTGAAQRNLDNLGAVWLLARRLGLQRIADFGGGDGLLCRLLRDRGLDATVVDAHREPSYGAGFGERVVGQAELVTAFEVFEHFDQPAQAIDALFAAKPRALLVSTEAWQGQGEGWWYLTPETGQHIFFYTRRALQAVAARHGHRLLVAGPYWLFVEEGRFGKGQLALLRKLLKPRWRRLRNAWAVTRPTAGVMADHARLMAARQPRPD